MYYLCDFCCICLDSKQDLVLVSVADANGMSYQSKMLSCLRGVIFNQITEKTVICKRCCLDVDFVFEFQRKCIKSRYRIQNYKTLLNAEEKAEAVLRVRLIDFVKNDKKLENLYPKCKNHEETDDLGVRREIKSECPNEHLDITAVDIKTEIVEIEPENECLEAGFDIPSNEDDHCHLTGIFSGAAPIESVAVTTGYSGDFKVETPFQVDATIQAENGEDFEDLQDPLMDLKNIKSDHDLSEECQDTTSLNINKDSLGPQQSSEAQKTVFKCQICGKIFIYEKFYQRHVLSHAEKSAFACRICQKNFLHKSSLSQHMVIHSDCKQHQCGVCGKRFARSNDLKRHSMIHSRVKPFECDVCLKQFRDVAILEKHKLIHTGIRPFECEVCKKKFIEPGYLNQHMAIHSGEKNYVCQICEKKFQTSSHLNRHMLIHTGLKPYGCGLCHTRFNQASSLNAHMLIHADIKLHECTVCQKKFRHTGTLNRHMLIHNKPKYYECEICQKKFGFSGNLIRHMAVHSEASSNDNNT